MVLSTETFNQSVRTEYSEAVNARYTFQPLWVSGLLLLYSAPRGFSPQTLVIASPQKPTYDFDFCTLPPISAQALLISVS